MNNNYHCLKEYGYIHKGQIENNSHNQIGIPESAFDYLVQCLQGEHQQSEVQPFLKFMIRNKRQTLQVRNYVGILRTPCGTQIEILPKIYTSKSDTTEDAAYTRNILLNMLRCLKDSPFKSSGHAQILDDKMPLLEIYITQFLGLVNRLVKRGIRSDYIKTQKNSKFLKGRLLIAKQLRNNTFRQDRMFVEYQEYQINRPANRLIKSTLGKIKKLTKNIRNQRLARELHFAFESVPNSSDYALDFQQVNTDRSMGYYKDVLAWCKLLLNGHGPTTIAGDFSTISLLYPMERLFEDYVAHHLRLQLTEILPEATSLKTQGKYHHLVESHLGKPMFGLRPDLIAMQSRQAICVMDTKWKLVDDHKKSKKYDISQSDMYQLYAYGHKYLKNKNKKDLWLIYPKTDNFSTPLPPFTYECDFVLRAIPFDLETGKLCFQTAAL